MNPWRRFGTPCVPTEGRIEELLCALWYPGDWHLRDDGSVTSIARRPIPSAGATYAVHTHVIVGGDGTDGLDPGHYAYDHDKGQLLRRDNARETAAGWELPRSPSPGSRLVFSVQPGRSFGRYRHRAWPLWIADAAYALEAVRFLLDTDFPTVFGPGPEIRAQLGVPPATETSAWLSRGLVPEIPLVSIELPSNWDIASQRRHALGRRRSPKLADFVRNPVRDTNAAHLAELAGQAWIAHADRIETWKIIPSASAETIYDALWHAHRAAARLCYDAALSQKVRCRPVSGIPAAAESWTMHAVAMLDGVENKEEKAE
ncbi:MULTISPECIES: nitroreductase family protein [Rhodococcus]|uniref:hypothetical protein n=1 Tax=Rhodococcus TaxID=1827 RepID=UPI001E4DB551|nr:hypothetical protein [Rhodococcus pyridinivorans]MCD2118268.1 hypothetical protein [Rhodococcus pyridinivorans]MCZ4627140.1 hypothetical protein [Rhodococcus pyridinivorans]MCZ4648322.1 hypothetical protein [Rhodococcus pyridinivorans]MDJ0481059.1 hypothetical protein [Rhodococcus pyridinivorans]MDV7254481.1 hypothetical protein [Rhodococcus pyridinivorans]